eukprot:gene13038-13139_t
MQNSGLQNTGLKAGRLSPGEYAKGFTDIHPPLDRHEAFVEADRCYFCFDAPCQKACPTSIDIPLFIRQISTGNDLGAAQTILESNILGGMCARVCPTETLCEEACVREVAEGKPVKIGLLQRHATDVALEKAEETKTHPFTRAMASGKKIAVVGAGPAGLSAAHRLSLLGHEVDLLDAHDKLGGLNEFGIAAYKATDHFAQREVDFILGIGGVTPKPGQKLGENVKLKALRKHYDAVFLGIGLGSVNKLGLRGENKLDGVDDAIEFIAQLRQAKDLATVPVGKRVVVVGGGMTAIDAAVQAKRLGAAEVTLVYRRGAEAMKASKYEQDLAKISGVTIRHWAQPAKLHGKDGAVTGISFDETALVKGRLEPTGERFKLAADMVLTAIGQVLVEDDFGGAEVLALKNSKISVDETRATSLKGVWAGGDCAATGEDLTVAAVEDGKTAAIAIDQFLRA